MLILMPDCVLHPEPVSSKGVFIASGGYHHLPVVKTDTGPETTRHDGQKGDDADFKRKEAQLARPAVLDLKQEADLDVRPFASNHSSSRVLWTRRT